MSCFRPISRNGLPTPESNHEITPTPTFDRSIRQLCLEEILLNTNVPILLMAAMVLLSEEAKAARRMC